RDDEVVRVRRAAGRRTGDLPSAGVAAFERGRALARRHLDVIEEDAQPLGGPVADVPDRDLNLAAGVRRQVDTPLLPAAGVAGRGVPLAGAAGRCARRVVDERLVVVELRVQVPPAGGAALPGALGRGL